MSVLAERDGDHPQSLAYATDALEIFHHYLGCSEMAAQTEKRIHGPQYEDRYVRGAYFRVGRKNDLQVWVSASKGSDLQFFVYVVNGSERRITMVPHLIRVDVPLQSRAGATETLKTYSAEDYERKVRNRDAWNLFAAAFAAGMANQPRPQTSSVSGSYYGSSYGSNGNYLYNGSYYGTITRWPSAADYADAQARTRVQMDGMRDQLDASFSQMSQTLMRIQTMDAGSYYGGLVYAQKRGRDYFVTVPFGGEDFEFAFSFKK